MLAFVIVGVADSVVNHTQSMRMFAARSEWDLKMSAVVAGGIMLVFAFVNLSMGVMGRALYPDVSALPGGLTDAIYPHLMRQIGAVGLNGFLVAGVMAASLSTYDSIGATLSALLTRDVYARLIVKNGTDRHYLWIGRVLTILVIGGSFAYVPFLEGGMLLFYLDLTSAFVVPLLTLYLMGTATRVHRKAGLVGLLAGTVYGMVRLVAPTLAARYGVRLLPAFLLDSSGAYLYSLLITAGVMIGVSLWIGWVPRGALFRAEADGWLRATQLEVRSQSSSVGAMRSAALPAVLAALAANLAKAKGKLTEAEEKAIVKHLAEAPAALNGALAYDEAIQAMAGIVAAARDVLYLGRGTDYPLALEGALKLKEISYIHAEGYAAGEMKHGPIALIDDAVPVIVIAPSGPLFEKTVSNMQEVQARGGKVILISDYDGIEAAGEGTVATITMPKVHPLIAPLVYAVPVQLLAYHVAVAKGTDVDQPRNLAKSVTVE
ncbi:MAG: SIS domain-containing protein [Proteobacteria bacterium]|nr:SIS domain-containing protein [Pseudomonadota bacterium]